MRKNNNKGKERWRWIMKKTKRVYDLEGGGGEVRFS